MNKLFLTRRELLRRAALILGGSALWSPATRALAEGMGVQILSVTFTPTTLRPGELLTVSIVVQNDSSETITTQMPNAGFVYEEGETFRGLGFREVVGAYRVGVDFDGREGWDHPYRWGLGAPLAPGQTVTVTGAIRLKNPQIRNYWAGLVHEWVAWRADRQGTQRITVAGSTGAPQISDVVFTPTTLRAGELLNVSIVVKNESGETLATQGPDPGFVYEEGESFRSRGFGETRGAYRVGVDFGGRTGIDHPYRWGLGAPLAPGETRIVTGAIRLRTPRTINYWAGLVQEWIAWKQDSIGTQAVNVIPAGAPRIVAVTFTPTTLRAGELLNVSIAVKNEAGETLTTQGPDPGFVYEEGDSFRGRGFGETRGAYRVGVDFEGRTGFDHPYRWGLGAPLAPGETRTVTGAIRLRTPRATNYWAGLVHEWVAWRQDNEGTQRVTVAPSGVRPRVVHAHSDAATTWTGQGDYWNYVNQNVVNDMVERGMLALTGAANSADAWRAILPRYEPGQGIAIKVNFNNSGNGRIDSLIQPVNAIVRGLKQIGVREEDVWVFDAIRPLPDRFVAACQFPGIRFFDSEKRTRATFDSTNPTATIAFAPPAGAPVPATTKIADLLLAATYVINLPLLKAHLGGAGVTLGFKNHLGSTNNPNAFHDYGFPGQNRFRNDYNSLVDLYRNPNIGAKTVLTIGDGLFTGNTWDSPVMKMRTFDDKLPNSLFFATDPVAIDCVMCDFLAAEWNIPAGADNYLRLASQQGLGVFERGDPWGAGYTAIEYRRIEVGQ